ncbi:hypothetical protein P3X46_020354 [Hevea brasiliensis]|uniref:CBS domain-containing protein n=1 Tax=Hevea brasiliensis TaxID=3981 RepID=A0ABQ9LLM6_HEVBR|nr:CBS domain-containing protein CBSX5 [Hevea brasiliensis]KAJ9168871.1 hypothetical protein P3X46_020354 [Hevea brasiliensis]
MAVSLLAREVSDLCLGKPALRSLSVSATVGDALSSLRRFGDPYLSVWSCDHHCNASRSKVSDVNECRCIGKVCMVDVICFLCEEDNLKNPGSALQEPVSVILPKVPGLVRHLEPNASLLEAIDLILEGAQNLVIPIHSPFSRKKLIHKPSSNSTLHDNRVQYCWLTQEDIIRYLLNCIGLFSPTPNYAVESLNIIDTKSILAVCYDEPASSSLPLISQSLVKQTSVAIIDVDGKLIGEISPYVLNSCNESVAAAIATLSTGDFMAYIDCGDPPEDLIRLVKERLEERNLGEALELLEEESEISASSSDEEFGLGRSGRLGRRSSRVVSNTDAIVCFPWSSLVAVMIQALSHRVSNVWVVEEDGTLVGIVTFAGMMKVFRERLKSMM